MTATAKFRIEGEDATAAAFRMALGNAQGTANKMAGLFKTAFAGISVAAIAGLGQRAIETGDELNKAAIKAGIGGKAMSELAYAAKMADVDLGGLSTSLRFMQKNLSEAGTGAKGPIEALAALGLKVSDLRNMAADSKFELLADRIAMLKDPADRSRAATELFGRAGADLLPLFEQGAAGIRAAREEAEKLGLSFDETQIQKLAAADDAIKRMKASFEGLAVTLTAKVAPALANFFDILAGNFERKSFGELDIDELKQLIEQAQKAPRSPTRDATLARFQARMREMLSAQNAANALRPQSPVAVPGFQASDAAIRAAEKSAKDLEKIQKDLSDFSISEQRRIADLSISETERLSEEAGQDWQRFHEFMSGMRDQEADEVEVHYSTLSDYAKRAAENMQDAFANFLFDPFQDGLKGMLKGFLDVIRRMVAEQAAAKIFGSKSSGGFGFGDVVGGFVDGLFGGFKAKGGPLEQGKWYIAGEKGPEPIWGGGAGAFAAGYGGVGGGGITQHISIDARGSSVESVKLLQATIPAIIRQAIDGARLAVRDDLSRGAIR